MRFPKPPLGIVSWPGNSRSYDAKPISGRRFIARVNSSVPSRRASDAAIGSAKNIQTWPPFPDRDRSSAVGTFQLAASFQECLGIARPILLIEIDGDEIASVVEQQRINAGDETSVATVAANAILTPQVTLDNCV